MQYFLFSINFIHVLFIPFSMSLMKMLNKLDNKMNPCGTHKTFSSHLTECYHHIWFTYHLNKIRVLQICTQKHLMDYYIKAHF